MACQCDRKDGKLEVLLSFRRQELLYDAGNIAFVEGDALTDEQAKQRQLVRDINEKGNADIVTRALNTAVAEIRESLYPYTKREIPTDTRPEPWKDVLDAPEIYILRLSLPEDFSLTTVQLLERELHDYLVFTALARWLGIVWPDAAAKWTELAAGAAERAKRSLHSRMKPRRLTIHGIY